MAEATLSVVICAHDERRWGFIEEAVASVAAQSVDPDEVILVVDYNEQLERRAQEAFPDVTVLPNVREKGLSGARNTGVEASRGAIVAFLDDDAAANPQWVESLKSGYEDETVLGVGGAIMPAWPEERPTFFPVAFDWVVGCTYEGLPLQRANVRNMIGANMSFRRDVFERIGGFDTGVGRNGHFPVGGEETELCIRALETTSHGRIVYEPTASVKHNVMPERTTWRYFLTRCYAEGITKSNVVRLTTRSAGLQTEQTYVRRVLPRAAARPVADAFRSRNPRLLTQTAAVVAGLFAATAGYAAGTVSSYRALAASN